jgi:uncharacterized protein
MASSKVTERTRRAVSEVLRRQGYVAAVDVFLQMGTLKQQDLEDWRLCRVPFLEQKLMGSLGKLSTSLREMRRICRELGLKPSETAYVKWGKGPKRALRFSKSGDPHVERAYRTHWVSRRLADQAARGEVGHAAHEGHAAAAAGESRAPEPESLRLPPARRIEADLGRVQRLADEKWDENLRLRQFLKTGGITEREVDQRFQKLYDWARSEIDCTVCANCCKTLPIVVTSTDAKRLAAGLGQSPAHFGETYLRTSAEGRVLAQQPCPFLEGTRCSCYEDRPTVCRSYPHLDRRDRVSRLLGVISSASTCPIVYNVLEALKAELGQRWRA